MGIGQNIKLLRIKNNLTQKDLAEKLHISFQAVSKWEKDESEPSFDTLREMAKIFNCSIDELFGVEKEPEVESKEDKITEVIVKEPEEIEEKRIDRIEISFRNINSNTIINIYDKFNWKLVSKVGNINLNLTKYIFEREITSENAELDFKAFMVKRYLEIENKKIVPKLLIFSSIVIILSMILAVLYRNYTEMLVIFLTLFFVFFIIDIVSLCILIKNLLNKKVEKDALKAWMNRYIPNYNLGYDDIENFISDLAKKGISVMDLGVYRSK